MQNVLMPSIMVMRLIKMVNRKHVCYMCGEKADFRMGNGKDICNKCYTFYMSIGYFDSERGKEWD